MTPHMDAGWATIIDSIAEATRVIAGLSELDLALAEWALRVPDARALYAYSAGRARRGKETTFRDAAKRFRCTYDHLEAAIEDYDGTGYLGAAVAIQVGGLGGPTSERMVRSDWIIEAYGEEGDDDVG